MHIETSLATASALVGRHLFTDRVIMRHPLAWRVDTSFGCEDPVYHTVTGRGSVLLPGEAGRKLFVDLKVRCRRCGWCLRQRAREWAVRAAGEIRRADRSWLITLTLSPESHFTMACRIPGKIWDFAARHREISKEITKYFKRLRKNGGPDGAKAKFRYCIVAEKHEGKKNGIPGKNYGMPHYHVLIHEDANAPLDLIKVGQHWKGSPHRKWGWGFVDAKCIETEFGNAEKAARYVCKYLTKSPEARVRASVRYGSVPEDEPNRSPTIDPPVSSEAGTLADRGPILQKEIAINRTIGRPPTSTHSPPLDENKEIGGTSDSGVRPKGSSECLIIRLLTSQPPQNTLPQQAFKVWESYH